MGISSQSEKLPSINMRAAWLFSYFVESQYALKESIKRMKSMVKNEKNLVCFIASPKNFLEYYIYTNNHVKVYRSFKKNATPA